MNRWIRLALAGLSFATVAFAATAQGIVREAPRDVKPGIMAVSATPPIITMDGKDDRLSPGARIRDVNNMMVLTGGLANKTVYTVYRRDGSGLVHEVWVLTEAEYSKLGGVNTGNPEGYKRFYEFLELIWAARALLLK
ncbi:hypothetical protein LZ009_22630 [Ramlibacter sp. XY19]|uniref:hypothetical protein n=1 Tax=Ramlibacter paludis TaxID=2908000 RepID=UPI0023DACFB1|nr:hypothetical protein [Ramlibacter paludis]MCG2595584.1 hypothetical protein [Ramlibacter paludis]